MSCLLDREAQMCAITLADEEEIDALEKKVDGDGVRFCSAFSQSHRTFGRSSLR